MFSLIALSLLFTVASSTPLVEQLGLKSNDSYNIQAVLVAGSNGWYNYRHQADVCHAYQVLRSHGVPAENIIVMMYDDIANASENPHPGKIFNIPKGPDVYAGVSKDYTGDEVNAENFLKVIKGDKGLAAKGKKVLTSGPNDHVFIYFADHGATGLIAFPEDTLSSDDLNKALVYMHDNKLYGKLTFYVEACESGSMFENILPKDINIYATTAANSEESSWGCYCDEKDIDTCLGDEYSVAWLQDSDKHDLTKETLEQQFKDVVKNTPRSHPQEFGTKSIADLVVGEFQGEKASSSNQLYRKVPARGSVNSRDIPLVMLRRKMIKTNDENEAASLHKQLSNLIAGRHFLESGMNKIVAQLCSAGFCSSVEEVMTTRRPLVNHSAHSTVVKKFNSSCLNVAVHNYAMKYIYVLANLVEANNFNETSLSHFLKALERACETHIVDNGFKAIV
uniref:legumain n=1 Tax=Tetranychus urticae TaxID=32264 RepID=T1KZI8_TETUR